MLEVIKLKLKFTRGLHYLRVEYFEDIFTLIIKKDETFQGRSSQHEISLKETGAGL